MSASAPIRRPAVLHLLEGEELVRLTRRRLNGRGAPICAQAASTAIEVAIANLVAARVELLAGNTKRLQAEAVQS